MAKIYHLYLKIDINLHEMEIKKEATLGVFTVKAELPEAGRGTAKPVILPTLLALWAH